ncbi:hypothetical protein E2562_018561 [Oryza meyeriana var. granulata]|uniref:Uncharacterized protein n=1 Tax=Oryza meyeriana var. granulata TaxID=110450 RepID=A0A6G1F956_9ORYZ|nr:hypothetical protein E2562_018561 [Oryza meyeriana var. granulata]
MASDCSRRPRMVEAVVGYNNDGHVACGRAPGAVVPSPPAWGTSEVGRSRRAEPRSSDAGGAL